jgi:hypothetical protein
MITLSTNLKAKYATTQFTNFDFDSAVKFGDKYFLAGDDGLLQFTGDTDNDTDIIGYFEPITTDFGLSQDKRIRFVYLSFEASSDLILTVATNKGHTGTYTIPVTSTGQHAARVAISRALYGRYFTFQVKNSPDDESVGFSNDFSIDSMSVLPIIRSHGFGQN